MFQVSMAHTSANTQQQKRHRAHHNSRMSEEELRQQDVPLFCSWQAQVAHTHHIGDIHWLMMIIECMDGLFVIMS